jgi:mxaD protein
MKPSHRIVIFLSLLSCVAEAHGPTPQKADESVLIEASQEKTWALVKEFDRIADWHPDIKASQGDGENEPGGQRTITLTNDGLLVESLDYFSEADHEYNYRLTTENVETLPVSFYTASIQLSAEGDKTRVKWKSRFYRGDTSNFPPDHLNDEAAVKAMRRFIKNGLQGLKQALE